MKGEVKPHALRMIARVLGGLLVAMLMPVTAPADGPIASSSFVGVEDPLFENGAWAPLTSLAPHGSRFQKTNGAYPDQGFYPNHGGARTTAAIPADHYSEIVVGHVGSKISNVGPIVRVQTSGPSVDSHYLWWGSTPDGVNGLYRIDANGATYTANLLAPTSSVVDGDKLRLVARGQAIYGIKNGVREFFYRTSTDATRYSGGTAGILAYAGDGVLTNAVIASWSAGAAVSSGAWASSTFAGTENPLDEGDRWYPLPSYSGFKKTGGAAFGLDAIHNAEGVWSITPPATQYSEVTLGTVASGGGGPIVRIDRTNTGQTGWLLFLYADKPSSSGIYKMNPDGTFTIGQLFTPVVSPGDKWRLTAEGNTLQVFQNGVLQFMYATDGSYPTGDVGIEAFTPAFAFTGWEGGDLAGLNSTLTVIGAGAGSGTVTSAPTGITCGANCLAAYANGSRVTLTPTPAPGSVFTGWQGGGCAGVDPCTVTLTADTTVTATFDLQIFALTVVSAGTGSGTVASSPAGSTCGTSCWRYTSGSRVTLTPTPAPGSVFTGWQGGGCAGTASCTVTLTADTTVTVGFALRVATPSLSLAGGTYNLPQVVSIRTATPGATIHYTTNGTPPTTASPVYSGPISVTRTMTIKAMAAASGMVDSYLASATYTLQAATPTFSPAGGIYTFPQSVSIADASPGVTIYYTTDGSTPTTTSRVYTLPIVVQPVFNGSLPIITATTVKTMAVAPGWSPSPVASATYDIRL